MDVIAKTHRVDLLAFYIDDGIVVALDEVLRTVLRFSARFMSKASVLTSSLTNALSGANGAIFGGQKYISAVREADF